MKRHAPAFKFLMHSGQWASFPLLIKALTDYVLIMTDW